VKCSWEDTFSEIVSKLDKIPEEAVVEKILISKSEKIVDPAHIVSLDTPVIVCEQFGCFNICIVLQPQAAVAPTAGRSASEVLMASAREIVLPPPLAAPDGKQLRTDQRLYSGKARCVYAHSRLTSDQVSELDHNLYTCGSFLSPSDDCFIVVREALVRSSPIETQYCGATLVRFSPICYHWYE
jgi:hypothetical protein